jgi:hypothetical protein
MKFLNKPVTYTRQDFKSINEAFSELKANSVLGKIENYENKWMGRVLRIVNYHPQGKQRKGQPPKIIQNEFKIHCFI